MAALEQGPALALFDEEVRAEFGDPRRVLRLRRRLAAHAGRHPRRHGPGPPR